MNTQAHFVAAPSNTHLHYNMTDVRFHPWQGSNFQNGLNGLKTLILGESHYQWKGVGDINEWPEITKTLIKEQIAGAYTKAFWTNIAVAFLNHRPSRSDKERFWQSIAFYNYVQESAGEGPRIRPSGGSWSRSEAAFSQVIESLKPDFILVLGYQNWNKLPGLSRIAGPRIEAAAQKSTWLYSHSNGKFALAFGVKHPSSGFNGRKWHPHIMHAMSLARNPLEHPSS